MDEPRGRSKYYRHRQIVNMALIDQDDFNDNVILCIPRFAWKVARAFLSVQGMWKTTYSYGYNIDHYVTPSDIEMDVIQQSISAALEVNDMSCDLVTAINNLTGQLSTDNNLLRSILQQGLGNIAASSGCGAGCGGSGGSGATDGPASTFEDDGSNYPDDFNDRSDYLTWKCEMAHLILDQVIADLEWLQEIEATNIVATALAATLLTPIPLDDMGVLVGTIVTYGIEGILDSALTAIIADINAQYDTLKCQLYYAITTSSAAQVIDDFIDNYLSSTEGLLLSFFITNDSLNRLFEEGNYVFGSNDCSDCITGCTGTMVYGAVDGGGELNCEIWSSFRVNSSLITTNYGPVYGIAFNLPADRNIRVDNIINYVDIDNPNYQDDYRVYSDQIGGTIVESEEDVPPPVFVTPTGRGFYFHSAQGFSIDFTVVPSQ